MEGFTVISGQQQPAHQGDTQGAEDGGTNGQADVDHSRALDNGCGDKKSGRQMEEVAGQTIEQIGQDEFPPAELVLFIAFGEHGVGRHAGKKTERKGCPGQRGEVPKPCQGLCDNGQFSGPVERLDKQRRQQSHGQIDQQAQQRPAKVEPELNQVLLGDHRVSRGALVVGEH